MDIVLLKIEGSKRLGLGCNEGLRMEKKQWEENVGKDEEDSD